MNDFHHNFYKNNSEKHEKYEFAELGSLISGEKPNFIKHLKKLANKSLKVLDIGCGSGELTLKISPFFKEIIGLDYFENYINSANQLKKAYSCNNVYFKVADGKNLPFENEFFDIIISSRGPLSSNIDFLQESFRVLRKGGLMIEETIGEKDKIELKQLFKRGQNFPYQETKLVSVKKLLSKLNMNLIYSKYFEFYQSYSSIDAILELLERAPIIPNFDKIRDKDCLESIQYKVDKIKMSSHRLLWIAKK